LIPDGVGIAFSPKTGLTAMTSGSFSIDFRPTEKNGASGAFSIRLILDDANYYEICNADSTMCPGVNGIRKNLGGVHELSTPFAGDYSQATDYHITVSFSPTQVKVSAFGELLVFDTNDTTALSVNTFAIDAAQQDAYYDNIMWGFSSSCNNYCSRYQFHV